MDEVSNVEISCREVTVSNKKKKKSSSKIIAHLKFCLQNGRHKHMLQYCNDEKTEFKVFLRNKKKRGWDRKNISLFEDLDDITSPNKYDKTSDKYPEESRVRYKSNMLRLRKGKHLEEIEHDEEEIKQEEKDRSLKILKFKFLKPQITDEKNGKPPAVKKKLARCRSKIGKRISETEANPSCSKKMRTSPLVLPGDSMKNIQNDGGDPMSGSNSVFYSLQNPAMGNLMNASSLVVPLNGINEDININNMLRAISPNSYTVNIQFINCIPSPEYVKKIENSHNICTGDVQNEDCVSGTFNDNNMRNGDDICGGDVQNENGFSGTFNDNNMRNGDNICAGDVQNENGFSSTFNDNNMRNGDNICGGDVQNENGFLSTFNDNNMRNGDVLAFEESCLPELDFLDDCEFFYVNETDEERKVLTDFSWDPLLSSTMQTQRDTTSPMSYEDNFQPIGEYEMNASYKQCDTMPDN